MLFWKRSGVYEALPKKTRYGLTVDTCLRGTNKSEAFHAHQPDMVHARSGLTLANLMMHDGVCAYNRRRRIDHGLEVDRGDCRYLLQEINKITVELSGMKLYDDVEVDAGHGRGLLRRLLFTHNRALLRRRRRRRCRRGRGN